MKRTILLSALVSAAWIIFIILGGKTIGNYFCSGYHDLGGLSCGISIGFYAIVVLPILFAIGFGIRGYTTSTERRLKGALTSFGVFIATYLVFFAAYYLWLDLSTRQERAAENLKFQQEQVDFLYQSYSIWILDSTGATINNDFQDPPISIQSPYTIRANVLEAGALPDGTLTAEIKTADKGIIATAKLLPTDQILHGRRFFQGTITFSKYSGAINAELIVHGRESDRIGRIVVTFQ